MRQKDYLIALGCAIRARRKTLRISQEKLAEIADLHPTYISEIERGCVNASVYSIFVITNALGMEISDLLNLSASSLNRPLENELAEVSQRIRALETGKQRMLINALKGMLIGLND